MTGGLLSLGLFLHSLSFAAHPIRTPAPEFPSEEIWVNAKPLTLARLRNRRGVVVAFINTANINSLRALKTLNKWHEAFQLKGLMIIGVHTPIYSYQRDPANTAKELRRLGVDFPVILDNRRAIWEAYKNEGWPAFYLIDRKGRIVYDLAGETRYPDFETEIKAVLSDLGYDTKADLLSKDVETIDCGGATTERAVPVNKELEEEEEVARTIITASRDGELTRRGAWRADNDALRLTEGNPRLDKKLRLIYRGRQMFAALGPQPGAKASRVFVKQNDLWLHAGNASREIQFDEDGQSYVDVSYPRLFWLTQNPDDNPHALDLIPARSGAAVFGFSFTDKCLPYEP